MRVMVPILFFVAVIVLSFWLSFNVVTPRLLEWADATRPRCPEGYVLTGGTFTRDICVPGVEPTRP